MKKFTPILVLVLLLLSSCSSKKDSSSNTKSTSDNVTTEQSKTSNSSTTQSPFYPESSSSDTTTPSDSETLFEYTFDENRPVLVDVDGEYRESNSTAFTITTIEAVTSNNYREQLQKFYNDGAHMMYEEETNTNTTIPTGFILVYKGENLQEKFWVGKENIDIDRGMTAYQNLLDKEKEEKNVSW